MYIAIRSEVDSRVLVYPLIKSLWEYGSVLLVSSNKQIRRLVEDEDTMTMRNITILVDEVASADEILGGYGIKNEDYDFVILDNVGAVDYDVYFIPLGALHSPEFDETVNMMLTSEEADKVYLFQFGKQVKKPVTKEKKPARGKTATAREAESFEGYEAPEVDNERQPKRKDIGKPANCKFPTYENMEMVEAEHKFYNPDEGMVAAFYQIFKDRLAVDSNQFRKEATKKDEYSGYIKSRNTIGD